MRDWQKVEAVLFGSGKYLSEDQISELSDIPENKLKKALNELLKHYENIESSLKVYNELDTWKLNVKEAYTGIMKNVMSDAEMPKPILETLAIIAYKAPVLQSNIIDARGSGAYEHISLLEKKGFIQKEKYGRTYKIRLGDKFFDYFDIEGPAKVQEVFVNIKAPEKIGELQVYQKKNEEKEFTQQITQRLKKVEITEQDTIQGEESLDKMDEKLESAKERIDEAEKELSEFKREEPEETLADDPQEEHSPKEILDKVNKEIDEITGEKEAEEKQEGDEVDSDKKS